MDSVCDKYEDNIAALSDSVPTRGARRCPRTSDYPPLISCHVSLSRAVTLPALLSRGCCVTLASVLVHLLHRYKILLCVRNVNETCTKSLTWDRKIYSRYIINNYFQTLLSPKYAPTPKCHLSTWHVMRVVVLELLGSPSPVPSLATFYVYYLKGSQISKTSRIITDI